MKRKPQHQIVKLPKRLLAIGTPIFNPILGTTVTIGELNLKESHWLINELLKELDERAAVIGRITRITELYYEKERQKNL